MAAARFGDSDQADAARVVAAAHTGFFDTRGTSTTSRLFRSAILWASRRPEPGRATVGVRAEKLAVFLAQKEDDRTWKNACGRTTGHDFSFNLAEAFGWSAYRTALTRLMQSLQGRPDPGLDAKDHDFNRNRFYLLVCEAPGRNLDRSFSVSVGRPAGGPQRAKEQAQKRASE